MSDTLPNSLPRRTKIDLSISSHGLNWFYLFCANCGADGGRVLETELGNEFAFYLCNPCAEKHGEIAGTFMVPDGAFGIRRD
jgi:hypothetical protein